MRGKSIRVRDVLLVVAVSVFFVPATIFPYVRKRAHEDLAITQSRQSAAASLPV